jgi:signal transduction histidine kinase/ActR/RegA family two-component response regulator
MSASPTRTALADVRLAALLAFLVLGALIWVRYVEALRQVETATMAERANAAATGLLTIAVDAQNAARGYGLTGEPAYLAHVSAWQSQVPAQIDTLRRSAADEGEARARIEAFLQAFSGVMATSDHLVSARRTGGIADVVRTMREEAAVAKVDTLRVDAAALTAVIRQRVSDERTATQKSRMLTGYLMLATFAFAIGMLAYAGQSMRRELGRRADAEKDLLESQAEVERQIETRTRELLAARAEAETASRIKDTFLAAVSHELRTPLNAIVGWTQILKVDSGENRARAVEAIDRNAHVQTRLIDDLLDMSRMIQGRFGLSLGPTDLGDAVRAALVTLAPAADAKGVSLTVHGEANVLIRGDESRLQQVTWNLLSNAVKFTPRGGAVTVDIVRVGPRAELRIADTGDGIEPDFLPHVFDPFRQGPARSTRVGLGLGLAIVRQIVELHGGTVHATSAGHHQGSSFVVSLPTMAASVVPPLMPASVGALDRLSGRVLVVEDDADSAETLAALLNHRGCDVRVAGTVADALAAFAVALPDVLLCDIGLPDGDGYALLRDLRRRYPQWAGQAIALSAFAREEDRERAAEAGFVAYLTKPYEVTQLFERIRQVTNARAAS